MTSSLDRKLEASQRRLEEERKARPGAGGPTSGLTDTASTPRRALVADDEIKDDPIPEAIPSGQVVDFALDLNTGLIRANPNRSMRISIDPASGDDVMCVEVFDADSGNLCEQSTTSLRAMMVNRQPVRMSFPTEAQTYIVDRGVAIPGAEPGLPQGTEEIFTATYEGKTIVSNPAEWRWPKTEQERDEVLKLAPPTRVLLWEGRAGQPGQQVTVTFTDEAAEIEIPAWLAIKPYRRPRSRQEQQNAAVAELMLYADSYLRAEFLQRLRTEFPDAFDVRELDRLTRGIRRKPSGASHGQADDEATRRGSI